MIPQIISNSISPNNEYHYVILDAFDNTIVAGFVSTFNIMNFENYIRVDSVQGIDFSSIYYDKNNHRFVNKEKTTYFNYIINADEFRKRFTRDERIAIKSKAGDPIVSEFIIDLDSTSPVNLQDSEIISALNHISMMYKFLTQNRISELLKPETYEGYC